MKKFNVIIALFACISMFAQNKVGEHVMELKASKTVFRQFTVLTTVADPQDSGIDKTVDNATFATINAAQVNDIAANKYETIEVTIPYDGSTKVVELYKVDLFNENFHVDTDKARSVGYDKGAYYRGIVKGNINSIVAMNFFKNELNGIISDESVKNLVIGKLDRANNTSDYIIYSDAQMKVPSGFSCSVNDDAHPQVDHDHDSELAHRDVQSARCVTMYFEIDYDTFLANGSNTTTTSNWMTSVFNNVQTLYNNDGITISLKSVYIWTEDDPYTGTSSFEYLAQFNQVRPVFDGDVGQLVGIDPGGLGGVAVTIEGLCSAENYSYSDINFSYNTVPTYSWTIMVITHEMGHLLGSRHTHACVWNGNNTAIDGCQTVEGSCSPGPIPSGTGGTIMSYCHLVGSAGINFNNGFGFQPANAILSAVNGSTCLSTDCVSTCINTVTDISVTSPTPTSVNVSWTDIGSGPWQVAVLTLTSQFPNWQTTSTPSRLFTGLNANSYYKVRIRPVCAPGMTATYRERIFATSAVWCNNIVITDTGGAANNHGNMESYVRTFIPTDTNKKIVLTFSSFGLELDYDYLYVYDGADTNAPLLGAFTGSTIPGPFTSTAADGSLTLRFESDPLEVAAGYVANVSCTTMLGLDDLTPGADFSYYPNPTNGAVSIVSKTEITDIMVYNVAGQLLYQRKLNELETQVDISAFSTGTYFFKLRFNEIEANFKILKM